MYQILYLAYCLPEMKNEDLINFFCNHPLLSHLFFRVFDYCHFYFFACLFLITLNNILMPQFFMQQVSFSQAIVLGIKRINFIFCN